MNRKDALKILLLTNCNQQVAELLLRYCIEQDEVVQLLSYVLSYDLEHIDGDDDVLFKDNCPSVKLMRALYEISADISNYVKHFPRLCLAHIKKIKLQLITAKAELSTEFPSDSTRRDVEHMKQAVTAVISNLDSSNNPMPAILKYFLKEMYAKSAGVEDGERHSLLSTFLIVMLISPSILSTKKPKRMKQKHWPVLSSNLFCLSRLLNSVACFRCDHSKNFYVMSKEIYQFMKIQNAILCDTYLTIVQSKLNYNSLRLTPTKRKAKTYTLTPTITVRLCKTCKELTENEILSFDDTYSCLLKSFGTVITLKYYFTIPRTSITDSIQITNENWSVLLQSLYIILPESKKLVLTAETVHPACWSAEQTFLWLKHIENFDIGAEHLKRIRTYIDKSPYYWYSIDNLTGILACCDIKRESVVKQLDISITYQLNMNY